MSTDERVEYLRNHEVDIQSQTFMDGNAKVDDPNAISKKYRGKIGGLMVGGWCENEEEAIDNARTFKENNT